MERQAGDNGYRAFWKERTMEVWAPTSLAAQQKAAALWKARKSWEVTVVLCETSEGVEVVHVPSD